MGSDVAWRIVSSSIPGALRAILDALLRGNRHCATCGGSIRVRLGLVMMIVLIGLAVFAGWYSYSRVSNRADHWQQIAQEREIQAQRSRSELQGLRAEPEAVRLSGELNALKEKHAAAEAHPSELDSLRAQVANVESQRAELESNNRQWLGQIDDLRGEVSVSKNDRERLQRSLRETEAELIELRDKLAVATSQIIQRDDAIIVLRGEVGDRKLYKSNYAASWEKLNGWLGSHRAISRQEVLDILGNPSEVKSNFNRPAMNWHYHLPNHRRGAVYFTHGDKGDYVTRIDAPDLDK